jgi:hypothetical protein
MNREKKAVKEQPLHPPVESRKMATKGFTAVTQFLNPDKLSQFTNALPAQLKSGVERLSGLPMDDVRVNYNSTAPAQLGTLAYARGNQIDLGPGQEQHLPHEAWHVVQQKQGRVKPALQAKGLAINDDLALETEADMMGQRTTQLKTAGDFSGTAPLNNPVSQSADIIQRKIGFEFQAVDSIFFKRSAVSHGEKRVGPTQR